MPPLRIVARLADLVFASGRLQAACQARSALTVQTRIDADKISARLWGGSIRIFIRGSCGAGQPEIIPGRIDNESVRHEFRDDDGQVWRRGEPG